jgi:hypothetical protein
LRKDDVGAATITQGIVHNIATRREETGTVASTMQPTSNSDGINEERKGVCPIREHTLEQQSRDSTNDGRLCTRSRDEAKKILPDGIHPLWDAGAVVCAERLGENRLRSIRRCKLIPRATVQHAILI